jgi:hypothetical protein
VVPGYCFAPKCKRIFSGRLTEVSASETLIQVLFSVGSSKMVDDQDFRFSQC